MEDVLNDVAFEGGVKKHWIAPFKLRVVASDHATQFDTNALLQEVANQEKDERNIIKRWIKSVV